MSTNLNNNSSRGWLFDLVNGIANDLATTNHLHEAYYGAYKDTLDEIEGSAKRLINYKKLLLMSVDNRRDKMRTLIEQADDYDDKMWCPLKHSIESYMEAMEVWQAFESEDTFKQMVKSTELMAGILSLALGMELETCARCLSDSLKNGKIDNPTTVGRLRQDKE